MKVLIANWVYNWGSTGYILRDLRDELTKQGIDVVTVCGVNLGEKDDSVYCVSPRMEKYLFAKASHFGGSHFDGSPFAAKRLIKIIKKEKPDVVHFHLMHCNCLNFFMVLKFLSANNIKTVITHHAEINYTGGCGYTFECKKWIGEGCLGCEKPKEVTSNILFANPHRNWKRLYKDLSSFSSHNLVYTTVSPWLKNQFVKSPISKGYRCEVVMNGIDTNIFKKRAINDRMKELGLNPYTYIVYVSAMFDPANINDIKGGYYLNKVALQMPDQRFLVVATKSANCDNLPSNIILWGNAENQKELAELYSNAKLTLLTSRKETFSMICAESLCCGTRVVGFEAGGPETISLKEYSEFVEYPDVRKLLESIRKMMKEEYDSNQLLKMAKECYSRKKMADNYISIYELLLLSR